MRRLSSAEADRITVSVRVHGELRARYPGLGAVEVVELRRGATLAELIDGLGRVDELWLTCVDGAVAREGRVLEDGVTVDLYPAVEGG